MTYHLRLNQFVLGLCVLATGCSAPKPSTEIEADLRRLQESHSTYIGFIDHQTLALDWISLDGRLDGGTRQLKLTEAELGRISAARDHASFDVGGQTLTSPNGQWVLRQHEGDLIVEELEQGNRRSIAQINHIVGKVHWSPDSTLVMYVERASRWDPTALRALDNVVYVTVYRCRDAQK